MKFNIGQWVMKPGVRSCNAEQIRDYRLSADKTEFYIYTLCHQYTGANLDGPDPRHFSPGGYDPAPDRPFQRRPEKIPEI